jgi:hypothetical protein
MLESGLNWGAVGGRVIERSLGCIGRLQDDFLLGDSAQRTVRLLSLRGLIPLSTSPLFFFFLLLLFSTPQLINFTSYNLIGAQLLWKKRRNLHFPEQGSRNQSSFTSSIFFNAGGATRCKQGISGT